MRKTINKIANNKKIMFSIVIALLIISLSSISLVRYFSGDPLLYGQETYYHLSQVRNALDGKISFLDLNPLEGLIVPIELIPNNDISMLLLFILPIAITLISAMLYLTFSYRVKVNNTKNFLFLMIMIISPSFIYSFTTISNAMAIIFLIITGLFLLSSNKKKIQVLSIFPFILVTMFDILATFLMIVTLSFFYLAWLKDRKYDNKSSKDNKNKKISNKRKSKDSHEKVTFGTKLFKILLVIIIIFTGLFKTLLNQAWLSSSGLSNNFWSNIISDFGGLSGISIFVIISSVLGFYVYLKEKRTLFFLALLLFLIPCYYYNNNCVIYINIILVFLATEAIYWLLERNWSVKEIKNFTILLLVLGMIFSNLTYIDRVTEYQPSQEATEILTWLEGYSNENYLNDETKSRTTVLSIPENDYYVEYLVGLNSLTKSEHTIDADNIFHMTYPNRLFPILEGEDIKYIYIDPKTKEKYSDQQGLIFALRNEKFKLIHSEGDYEVWKFDIES